MSSSFWVSEDVTLVGSSTRSRPRQSTALNFFVALTSTNLKIFGAATLKISGFLSRFVGSGGYSVVQIGESPSGGIVAVKSSRSLSRALVEDADGLFERYLGQLVLEIRILTHAQLRKHKNIIDILGVQVDENSGSPSLSIVLEFSTLGTLGSFLKDGTESLDATALVELLYQVSRGLEALHKIKVCHGDVKMNNVLIFEENRLLIAKISDFGQSVVSSQGDSLGRVDCPYGTPLLNAPEVRQGIAAGDPNFNIDSALLTDIFSFGLLVWEVLKNGQSYFDPQWIPQSQVSRERPDVELIESFLNSLDHDTLAQYGQRFLATLNLEPSLESKILDIIQGCLRDHPPSRISMSSVVKRLQYHGDNAKAESNHGNIEQRSDLDGLKSTGSDEEELLSWTVQYSLSENLDRNKNMLRSQIPMKIQQLAIQELKALATSPAASSEDRAHAAMTVSESYAMGFGVPHNDAEVVYWLDIAASEGLVKAQLWYHRVCSAFGITARITAYTASGQLLEEQLSSVQPEMYLQHRVQLANLQILERARGAVTSLLPNESISFRLALFNDWDIDELSSLHLAALLGDDTTLNHLLHQENTDIDVRSACGFTAIHYACVGGHLSTLAILINQGADVSVQACDGITVLHLSIFFPTGLVADCINLLIGHGAPTDISSEAIKWDAHDLVISGTPINWAIYTRNRALVRLLIPQSACQNGYEIAVSQFFWEIAEDFVPYRGHGESIPLCAIDRPFRHYIAHGRDRALHIKQTVRLCDQNDVFKAQYADGETYLTWLLNMARLEDDLHVINCVLAVTPAVLVKQATRKSNTALLLAISQARNSTIWRSTLQALVESYTVEELEDSVYNGCTYLHMAIILDSVVGARVLLEKGVNVNQATSDDNMTPLHECISGEASAAMFSLLMQYGAVLNNREAVTGATPLQYLLSVRPELSLIEVALEYESDDSTLVTALHGLHGISMSLGEGVRTDARESFRYLLSHPKLKKYLDATDENDVTMLQRAAYQLNLDIVRLLLDAGADASIPFTVNGMRLLPLQIACLFGRLLRLSEKENTSTRRTQRDALKVATELLRWHEAKGSIDFQGITALHLASLMWIRGEDVTQIFGEGYDLEARGYWPGFDDPVTSIALREATFEREMESIGAGIDRLAAIVRLRSGNIFGDASNL